MPNVDTLVSPPLRTAVDQLQRRMAPRRAKVAKKDVEEEDTSAAPDPTAAQHVDLGGDDDDSGDDPPEELTLATSRTLAASRRQQVQSQVKAQQSKVKEAAAARRDERNHRRKQQAEQQQDAQQRHLPTSVSGHDSDGLTADQDDEGVDLLPTSVTTALALSRRELAETARQRQADAVASALQKDRVHQSVKQKRMPLVAVQKGPVTVAVLAAANLHTAEAGSNFLHEQLYSNSRLTRSTEVLSVPRGAKAARATSSACWHPAADFLPKQQAAAGAGGQA